jgi:hypothetical protein
MTGTSEESDVNDKSQCETREEGEGDRTQFLQLDCPSRDRWLLCASLIQNAGTIILTVPPE